MTDRPRPITETENLSGSVRGSSSVSLPCRQACVKQAVLGSVELAGRRELRLDELGQCEIHVVAAEQQVIADRLADKGEAALVFAGLDEREIRGAAADIDDQAMIAGFELGGFGGRMRRQPAIKRGLRFFEQRQVLDAGLAPSNT